MAQTILIVMPFSSDFGIDSEQAAFTPTKGEIIGKWYDDKEKARKQRQDHFVDSRHSAQLFENGKCSMIKKHNHSMIIDLVQERWWRGPKTTIIIYS